MLLASQPTRGVDLGAAENIHDAILRLRNSGTAVLLVSSDLDELFKLADRVVVLYQGKIHLELSRSEFDEMRVGRAMTGA